MAYLQTRAPSYTKGSLHNIQTSAPYRYAGRRGRQEPIQTGPLQTKWHYRKWVLTYKGLHYRQEALQTRGPYKQGVHTDKGSLQQNTPKGTPTDAVQFLQTRGPYMIYRQGRKWPHRQGVPTEQGALADALHFVQERRPHKQGTSTWYTDKGPLLPIQARGHHKTYQLLFSQISRK